jgi:clan AA aspartic protease
MGLTYADITLWNLFEVDLARTGRMEKDDVRKIEVSALVDSGAYMLTVDESVKTQLGLTVRDTRKVELADGSLYDCDIVGPIELRFKNRRTICEALVLPGATEVLLGAIPLEGLDVLIDPISQQLIVHPLRPDIAGTKCK